MDWVKRHLWLVITLAVMLVLSAVALVYRHTQNATYEARNEVLKNSLRQAEQIDPVQPDAIVPLVTANEEAKKELEAIRRYLGRHSWTLLLEGRPQWFRFQGRFSTALGELIQKMGGVKLTPENAKLVALEGPVKASVIVRETAFQTDAVKAVVNVAVAPGDTAALQQMQMAQEDLWLIEDLVEAIAKTNSSHFTQAGIEQPTIAEAIVKELVQIEIGAGYAQLQKSAGSRSSGRYLQLKKESSGAGLIDVAAPVDLGAPNEQAMTITGHAGDNNAGTYKVLPFRMTVVVDAANSLELLRQLPFNRSFITVLNVNQTTVFDTEADYQKNLLVSTPEEREAVYGNRPLMLMEIVGESLIFTDPAVRPVLGGATTPPAADAVNTGL